jgi:hypothetical protein
MVPIKKMERETRETPRSRKAFFKKALFVLLGISVVFILVAGIASWFKSKANTDDRQAVFMTTGSVYFGFVKERSGNMLQINDAYYLTSVQSLYPKEPDKDKISLIKMGSEVYKPQSDITVNMDQVISIQKISADSQINKAILESTKK